MKKFPRINDQKFWLLFALAVVATMSLLVAYCGGGGGGGGTISVTTYTISGTVTSGGTGLSGVTITPSVGTATTTDASGNYTLSSFASGTYTITPSKTGYTFTPTSIQEAVNGANITNVNFTATAQAVAQVVNCSMATIAQTVTIANNTIAFNPSSVTITHGQVVEWVDNDTVSIHTVTSGTGPNGDGLFDSGNLNTGNTYCVQFNVANTYKFFCKYHYNLGMTGTVTVQ